MVIPKLHYISQGNSPKDHIAAIQKACTSGVEIVQLKIDSLTEKKYARLAQEAREITAHFQTRLLVTDYYKIAKEVKADGIHIEHNHICPTAARTSLFTWQLLGANANTITECEDLLRKEVDYIRLSPFKAIDGNTAIALGVKGYAAILDVLQSATPIIGFGNITPADIPAILKTGVSAVAIADAITEDFSCIRICNQLLNASVTAEQRYTFKP